MESAPPGLKYDDIVRLKASDEITLIDVRNADEVEKTGKLPGSFHIPLGELKYSLEHLSAAEFQLKHGLPKPALDARLVFSCRTGGRARSAMANTSSLGYKNVNFYDGGFLDWESRTKVQV